MQNFIFSILEDYNEKEYFEHYLAYLISPIITGIKPCSIININDNKKNILNSWRIYKDSFLSTLNLDYIIVKEEANKETVLIYNKVNLTNLLKCSNIRTFLGNYGYNDLDNIDSSLSYLNNRLKTQSYPHEIGIFLGIPIHDVEAFINSECKSCLLCGYWKVYSEAEYAIKLFKQYDLSKEMVTNCIIHKKNITHICNNLIFPQMLITP
jgi:hypothetical protein